MIFNRYFDLEETIMGAVPRDLGVIFNAMGLYNITKKVQSPVIWG